MFFVYQKKAVFLAVLTLLFFQEYILAQDKAKIQSVSYEKIQTNAQAVSYKLKRDFAAGAFLTAVAFYGSAVPLINLYNGLSDTKKNESVEPKTFINRLKSIGSGVVEFVFSEQLFIGLANGICTGLAGWMVHKVVGRVCYEDTINGYSIIHAPWEAKIKLMCNYMDLMKKYNEHPEKLAYYQSALIAVANCCVSDIEMILGFIEYKIKKIGDAPDSQLNKAIQQYLMGRTNQWILSMNNLLEQDQFDLEEINRLSTEFSAEFKAEIQHGGW